MFKISAQIGRFFLVNFGTQFTHNFGRSRYTYAVHSSHGSVRMALDPTGDPEIRQRLVPVAEMFGVLVATQLCRDCFINH